VCWDQLLDKLVDGKGKNINIIADTFGEDPNEF
jgi:hypothetical protein